MVLAHPSIQGKWEELQERFRTQFPKKGNTREELFAAWRSFHFDENAERIDAYVQRIRQVAVMLNYGEPQILEVLKNTLSSYFYWVLFPIDNLRQPVETAKGCSLRKS